MAMAFVDANDYLRVPARLSDRGRLQPGAKGHLRISTGGRASFKDDDLQAFTQICMKRVLDLSVSSAKTPLLRATRRPAVALRRVLLQ